MLSPKPTPSEQQQSDAHAAALQAYRDGRVKTFEAWLEHSHCRLYAIPGFRGITFPDSRTALHVRMATNQSAQDVMRLLEDARRDGFDVDSECFEIVQDGEGEDAPWVVQPKRSDAQ